MVSISEARRVQGGRQLGLGGWERWRAMRPAAAEQSSSVGGVPATDWIGKERGKGLLGMENLFYLQFQRISNVCDEF